MKIQMKGKEAEVLLYDDIGGFFGITASSFIKDIKALGDVSTINLRINSNGGNVFDGVAMYNYLKSHKAHVAVHVDGIAASIASIIAMAGDEVHMADNAWMMIHDPWVVTGGTSGELRKAADTMDGIRESLLDTYMVRANIDREEVSQMMTAETWLNATDAAAFGFIDSVSENLAIAASVHKDWFKNAPQSLIAEPPAPAVDVAEIAKQIRDAQPKHAQSKAALQRMESTIRRWR